MRKTANQIADTVLTKLASLKTELLPHQQRVIDRLREQEGLLVAHGLGTGKTLASIGAADALGGNTEALVPASLQDNYIKEIAKHTLKAPNISVRSMQGEALHGTQRPADLLIVDEAHRARETSTKLYQLLKKYPAAKRMLLSATPIYNRPSDIAPLVNIAAGSKALRTGQEFKTRYEGKTSPGLWDRIVHGEISEPTLKNKKELKKILNKWVDYEPTSEKDFPKRINENIDVEMTPQQTAIHASALGELPWLQQRRVNQGLPLEKKYLSELNAFQSQTRQIGGSTKKFTPGEATIAPKIQKALADFKGKLRKNDAHRAVVYSNYLDSLDDYSGALESADIPHATFTGKLPQKKRKAIIEDYNEGRLKALLVSSAGGEGLDLKGTRQLQVLEPHWNDAKLEQVIGRAIRRGSHAHLPEDQRNVAVQRYLARPKPGFIDNLLGNKPLGIEQVLSNMSDSKNALNNQVLELLRPKE